MTHPQQTTHPVSTIELPDGATLRKEPNGRQLWRLDRRGSPIRYLDEFEAMFIEAAITAGREALATQGEAVVKLIPTAEELGAPQVEPAPVGINGLTQAETDATMSVRGLSEPAPSTAGELVVCAYYSSQGGCCESGEPCKADRHNDALLQSTALPVDAQERETKHVVSKIQTETIDKAALPVGELTDERIKKVRSDFVQYIRNGLDEYSAFDAAIDDYKAAARLQPVREPLITCRCFDDVARRFCIDKNRCTKVEAQ